MEAVHCAREAWPEFDTCQGTGTSGADEEEWAANPWQAQVDAHIMQLQQASGNGYRPLLGGIGMPVPVLCSVALPSQARQLPAGGVADVGLHAVNAACTPSTAAACRPGVAIPASASAPVAAADELVNRISDLEGHIALLEDTLMRKDKELEEMQQLQPHRGAPAPEGLPEQSSGGESPALDASELQRKNEFLSMLVTRFEKKTMDLEEEIVSLTLAKRDSAVETKQVFASDFKQDGELLVRINELEGQVALLDDVAAQKEGELRELEEQLRICRERREDARQQDSDLRAEVEGLKDRDVFLSGLVARFEEKTMKLECQVGELTAAKEEAESRTQQATIRQEELEAAQAEAAELRQEKQTAHSKTAELLEANASAEERIEEQRQAAESTALALRECKKDHNAKAQDLLRRMQMLEKQKRDLETENKRLELSLESATDTSVSASADEVQQVPVLAELQELKLLNAQLIEKLSKERAEHAQTRQTLQTVSYENETLTCRLHGVTEQLYDAVERNDRLQDELARLRESTAPSHLTLRSESDDLSSMS
mmetsp:Transcript_44333/g.77853  ORF Transcript_44333/g.77853 Transcript_44333/m.77853 type:complete len:544 (-) Transcript_44333:21-1652(-)